MMAEGSEEEAALADKVHGIFGYLVLQRPGRSSKVSKAVLERRLNLWESGELSTLHEQAQKCAAAARSRVGPAQAASGVDMVDGDCRMSIEHAERLRGLVAHGLIGRASSWLFGDWRPRPCHPGGCEEAGGASP